MFKRWWTIWTRTSWSNVSEAREMIRLGKTTSALGFFAYLLSCIILYDTTAWLIWVIPSSWVIAVGWIRETRAKGWIQGYQDRDSQDHG